MRKSFEERLYDQRDLAQHELEQESPDQDWERVVDHNIERLAQEEGVTPETQQQVFEIQKKKQEIMKRLKEYLRNLDDPEHREKIKEGEYRIEFYKGKYIWTRDDGKTQEVTLGDIMTDGEWGVDYYLDPSSVPRNVRKEYLIETAKREIQKALNRQIAATEIDFEPGLLAAYEGAAGISPESELSGGHLAERIVQNLIKKMQIDYGFDFKVKFADVFQDVIQKVDFIIRREQHRRGVDVEGDASPEAVIQFTTKTGGSLEHKREALERAQSREVADVEDFDDIVLVSIPLKQTALIYKIWEEKRDPGGPERWLAASIKEKIVIGLLRGMYSDDELDQMMETFREDFQITEKKRSVEYSHRKRVAKQKLQEARVSLQQEKWNKIWSEFSLVENEFRQVESRLKKGKQLKQKLKRRIKQVVSSYGENSEEATSIRAQLNALTHDRSELAKRFQELHKEKFKLENQLSKFRANGVRNQGDFTNERIAT